MTHACVASKMADEKAISLSSHAHSANRRNKLFWVRTSSKTSSSCSTIHKPPNRYLQMSNSSVNRHDGEFNLRLRTKRPWGRSNRSKLVIHGIRLIVQMVTAWRRQGRKAMEHSTGVQAWKDFLYVVIWLESLCSFDHNPSVVYR